MQTSLQKQIEQNHPLFPRIVARLVRNSAPLLSVVRGMETTTGSTRFRYANLAPVGADGRMEQVLDKYLSLIQGPVMITAANVIIGAAKIALAKPSLTAKVASAILKVEKARYQTRECRNVAIGHALNALRSLGPAVATRADVLAFVRRQTRNPRNATRQKALAFLKLWPEAKR